MNTEELLRVIRTHTLEALFLVMKVAVNIAEAIEKKGSTSKEYLGQTTYLQLRDP